VPVGYAAVLTGIVAAAGLHAAGAALREGLRHTSSDHRFLCPHCLRFGEYRFACGACGRAVDALTVHTYGAYVNDCPHCGVLLFSRDGESGVGVQAGCQHCARVCERQIYHEREVAVVGALRESDFAALCSAIGARPERTRGGIHAGCHDDGARLTYLLSLGNLPTFAAALPGAHALWAVERIWVDGNDVEPLKLGEAVDRFLQQTRLSAAGRQALAICVGGDAPSGASHRLLAARFGAVVDHVTPGHLIDAGAPRS
jgi:hypothetical protein